MGNCKSRSKMKRFKTQSPEATVTPSFRLETGRFQNEAFRKNHRETSIAMNKTKGKISIQDRKYGLKEASHPA